MKKDKREREREALAEFVKRNAEAISNSATFVALYNQDMAEDIVPVIQMGLAVYLDKPILLLIPESREGQLPQNLRKLATAIETFDDQRGDPREIEMSLQAATARLVRAAGLVE